jgi:transcriptional regulator with XRE-family HTH domain
MNDMDTRAQVTNERVAKDLGITHSAVSRIRTGSREPSFGLMVQIAKLYGWSLDSQAVAISNERYGEEFEWELKDHYA